MNDQAIKPDQAVFCLGCSYCLTGISSGQCPECGKAFDRSSLALHPSHNMRNIALLKWSRRLYYASAIQWLLLILVILLLILIESTNPVKGPKAVAPVASLIFFLTFSVICFGLLMLILLTPLSISTLGCVNTFPAVFMVIASSCCFLLGVILIPPLIFNEIELLWRLKPLRRKVDEPVT